MYKQTPLERRIEIVKLLQGVEMRTSEIADHFDISEEKTIREDIRALREGLDVFGTIIQIESKHYDGNPRQYYKSTVHPIMLALNLSELFALMKLLENASEDDLSGDLYKHIFDCVYNQMTKYAEDHIADKLKKRYRRTGTIRNQLEEEAVPKKKDYQLVYWLKSGRPIEITYRKDNTTTTVNARLRDFRDKKIEVEFEDMSALWLDYDDVLIDWTKVKYN